MRGKLFFFFLNFVLTPALAFGAGRIISSAVGRVQDHVLTSREVQIHQTLEGALAKTSADKIKISKDFDSPSFAKLVTSALLEWVVFLEAKNVSAINLEATEVSRSEIAVNPTLNRLADWKKLKVSNSELRSALERKLLAKKFIRFRADSSVVPVTDAEAQKYFEQNRSKFGNVGYEKFAANIKTFLTKQQVEKRLKDWFEVLQAKYKVRNFLAEI